MKKLKYILCCMLILSGCTPKNEPNENEQNKVVEPSTNTDSKDENKKDEEQKPAEDPKDKSEEKHDPEDKPVIEDTPEVIVPEEPEATTPSDTPEPSDDETPGAAGIDLESLSTQIQTTEIFSMSMALDNQQIADLYGNIGTDQFETAIVLKNMISPGGDETAIFKVKEGQMDVVKAGIEARDAYGKNEGSFYEMEQEMFNNSKILEFGDIIVYIAARNVDEVAEIVNQTLK